MMDAHDSAALAHYQSLIAERMPPDLAVALAAARYQVELAKPKALPQPPVAELPIIRVPKPAAKRRRL